MATEWYLMGSNTKPNMLGGYENQAFVDFKGDAFQEVLATDIAVDVEVCNSDLSERIPVRAIVQRNVGENYLSSQDRQILVEIGTLKTGDYVYFEGCYWIVIGYPGNNGIYEKTIMSICQYKIRWQNAAGDVIERWANFSTASKYDVGIYTNRYTTVPTNDMIMLLPDDNETILIEGKRIFVDRNLNDTRTVFRLTRMDDPLFFHHGHGSMLSFIADRDEMNPMRDRPDLLLCDYIEPNNSGDVQEGEFSSVINGNQEIKVGRAKTYTVVFTDENGNNVIPDNVNYRWGIVGEFADDINIVDQSNSNGTIKIKIVDDSFVDEAFKLQIYINDVLSTETTIRVVNLYS